jgi:prevent-host-death family protein
VTIEIGVHEAKTTFSALLRRVAAGEEITITSSGRPVARLIPAQRGPDRELGRDHGLFEVPADFDAPLPDDVLEAFGA